MGRVSNGSIQTATSIRSAAGLENKGNFWPKNDIEKWCKKIFLKFLHAQSPFPDLLHKSEDLGLEIKMTFFVHGGISIKNFMVNVHIIYRTFSHKFHPYSIFDT